MIDVAWNVVLEQMKRGGFLKTISRIEFGQGAPDFILGTKPLNPHCRCAQPWLQHPWRRSPPHKIGNCLMVKQRNKIGLSDSGFPTSNTHYQLVLKASRGCCAESGNRREFAKLGSGDHIVFFKSN